MTDLTSTIGKPLGGVADCDEQHNSLWCGDVRLRPSNTLLVLQRASSIAELRSVHHKQGDVPRKAVTPADSVSNLRLHKPKNRALTHQELKLLEASHSIATEPPSEADKTFNHAVFCQVGLPRAEVEGREFMRKSGEAWINVQAGVLDEGRGPVQQSLPYGPLPRLALAHVSTYAVLNKTREVPIGDSAAQFLKLMGIDDGGARYFNLRRQMHALAACRMQIGYRGRTFNGQAVEQFDAWAPAKSDQQRSLWPGLMVLSERFYQSLMEVPVPLDKRALHALKGSALALDVYAWLAHRLHRIRSGRVILHWKPLREQFAQEYVGEHADKDFKKKFLLALGHVLAAYPQARVKQVKGGLLLLPSPPPIAPKGT